MDDASNQAQKQEQLIGAFEGNLAMTAEIMGAWAAVVTIALVVIVALIFRRLRRKSKTLPDSATSYASSYAASNWNDAESAAGKEDDCTSVVDLEDSSSPRPGEEPVHSPKRGSSDPGHVNAGFDARDFSMLMNDAPPALPGPSVEVPVEIREKLETKMDGDTIGPMASLGPDAEEDAFVTPAHATDASPPNVNFRHAQFRGLSSNGSAGAVSGSSFFKN